MASSVRFGGVAAIWLRTFEERPQFGPSFGADSLLKDRQLIVGEPMRGPKKQVGEIVQQKVAT